MANVKLNTVILEQNKLICSKIFVKNKNKGFKKDKNKTIKDKGNIIKDTKGTKNKFNTGLKRLIEKLLYIVIGKLNKKEKKDILNKLLK